MKCDLSLSSLRLFMNNETRHQLTDFLYSLHFVARWYTNQSLLLLVLLLTNLMGWESHSDLPPLFHSLFMGCAFRVCLFIFNFHQLKLTLRFDEIGKWLQNKFVFSKTKLSNVLLMNQQHSCQTKTDLERKTHTHKRVCSRKFKSQRRNIYTVIIAWRFVVNKMLWFWSRQLRLIAKRLQMCIFIHSSFENEHQPTDQFVIRFNIHRVIVVVDDEQQQQQQHRQRRHCPLFSFPQYF